MMRAFFKWFLENIPATFNKINAATPTFNNIGYKVAIKLGFKDEGLNRQSYKRDGIIYDQHILGITRAEVKEVMKWAT